MRDGSPTFWPPPALFRNGVLEGVRHLWAAAFNPKAAKPRSGMLSVGSHKEPLVS
jgi:hypothetical protein